MHGYHADSLLRPVFGKKLNVNHVSISNTVFYLSKNNQLCLANRKNWQLDTVATNYIKNYESGVTVNNIYNLQT